MNWQSFWQSPIWDYSDKIGTAAALFAMLFSMLVWLHQKRKERKDNDLIYIRLKVEEPPNLITLHGQIRRKNLTRAEVQGLLGVLPMREQGKRYSLASLSHRAFFAALEKAQINTGIYEVTIPCTPAELQQFDQDNLGEVSEIQTRETT